jgi:hypothetical protein
MVKKWIIMSILAIILVTGCVFESKYINSSMNGLINSLETLQIELAENKDKIDTEEKYIGYMSERRCCIR